MNSGSEYWEYPIVTPAFLRDCAELGIDVNAEIFGLSAVAQLFALLNRFTKPLVDLLQSPSLVRDEKVIKDDFDATLYQQLPVALLPVIFKPLQEARFPGISLYLHGSMADQSYTSFSDVDDLVILRKEAWQDYNTFKAIGTVLTKIARGYQTVDPLQHHGHWLVTEFDLLSYDPSYLPPVVLGGAQRVVGDDRVEFLIQSDLSGFASNAAATIGSIYHRLRQAHRQGGLNAYFVKALAGEIAILPAYLCQAKGQTISKPAAIKRAQEMYSSLGYEAVAWASMVRKEFDICVKNFRMSVLQRCTRRVIRRRQQAEEFFKKFAIWISNEHPLGLNSDVRKAIEMFALESESLNTRKAETCE